MIEQSYIEERKGVIYSICKNLDIPTAIERSRSGNGAHVWLFFEEPVPAISARKNGNSEFIDEDFQSYPDQWAYLAS